MGNHMINNSNEPPNWRYFNKLLDVCMIMIFHL